MRKIIIDTDPGIDDAFAIIAALRYKDFDVLGITSVGGNKGLELTTTNSQKIIEFMNANIKVYPGAKEPLDNRNKLSMKKTSESGDEIHGKDGLGNVNLTFDDNVSLGNKNAVDFILEQARVYKGELEIITLGPLTNIATAINTDKETMKGVKAIYSMGGGINKFNRPGNSEFNYFFDPLAVKIVYDFGKFADIHMIGLDVTHKCIFTIEDLFFFGEELGATGKLLSHMANVYLKAYWREYKYLGVVIHDLLTVLYAIDQSICPVDSKVSLYVVTEDKNNGQTVIDSKNEFKNAFVPQLIDVKRAKNLFVELIDKKKLDLYKKHFN